MKYLELFKNGFDSTIIKKTNPENLPYIGYNPIDGFVFSITPNEDSTVYTIYRVVNKDISNCTYNMVDLELSVKWADRNVGATSPEDYGSYFQWGDTNAYTFGRVSEVTATEMASLLQPIVGNGMEVTADNVDMIYEQICTILTESDHLSTTTSVLGFILDKLFNWDSYFDTTDGGSTFNKYNNNGGLKVLESRDDAATIHMGSQYRTPTIDEIWELIDNTTQTYIDLNGNEYSQEQAENGAIEHGKLKGVRFTGLNGNSIFIPTAGCCYDSLFIEFDIYGVFWSSSLCADSNNSAKSFAFSCNRIYEDNDYRYYGFSVRGVQA